ncbi:MAG: GIY-YIG nuclease family protein [Solirubrobacterales bacterium]
MTASANEFSSEPFVVSIVMRDGDPAGVKVIEKSNWSGAGLEIPRPLLPSALKRDELSRPGVYILVGPPQDSELPTVYVGEGDVVRARIAQHEKLKEFWTHAVVFTSSANRLNKAHVRYLESSLVSMATAAKRCNLENGNAPQIPALSEGDMAEVGGFLTNLVQLLGVLGYRYFEKPAVKKSDQLQFTINSKGIEAKGYESSGGFIVIAGSAAIAVEVPSIQRHIRDTREALIEKAIMATQGDHFIFTQNYEFSSPSTAAGTVLGRSANGRSEWKTDDGRSLSDVQSAATGSEAT